MMMQSSLFSPSSINRRQVVLISFLIFVATSFLCCFIIKLLEHHQKPIILSLLRSVNGDSNSKPPQQEDIDDEKNNDKNGFDFLLRQNVVPVGSTPVSFLAQPDLNGTSPACLDGSPYGFYFVKSDSKSRSTKWTISINGGGWCYDEKKCFERSKTALGSSKQLPSTGGCDCMNPNEDGTMDTNCNCIHLPYCDGASFSGFRKGTWSVPSEKRTNTNEVDDDGDEEIMYFRGIANMDGIIDFALENGMDQATEVVVTGGSAGGLSTFLHMDRIAASLSENRMMKTTMNTNDDSGTNADKPKTKPKVRGAPVVGYFLDHDNLYHTRGGKEGPNTKEWVTPGTAANYTTWMKYIYYMQNLTFGNQMDADEDGYHGLDDRCSAKHPDEPWLCFMSPHMQDIITTPFFVFNSKYDSWQLNNELQIIKWDENHLKERLGVLEYGYDFMLQFEPVTTMKKNGAMITSCICHGCPWDKLMLHGKNSYQHYADWYYDDSITSNKKSDSINNGTVVIGSNRHIHIDPRFPNGHGTLEKLKQCINFYNNKDYQS